MTYLSPSQHVIDPVAEILSPLLQLDTRRALNDPNHISRWTATVSAERIFAPFHRGGAPLTGLWRAPTSDAILAAFQWATGEVENWNGGLLGRGNEWSEIYSFEEPGIEPGLALQRIQARTLAQRPGVILVQPLVLLPVPGTGDQGLPADEAQALRAAVTIVTTLRMYSGQALVGMGRFGIPGRVDNDGGNNVLDRQRLARQMPFFNHPVMAFGGPRDDRPFIDVSNTDGVRIEMLDLQSLGVRDGPAISLDGAQNLTISDVDIDADFLTPFGRETSASDVWIEGTRIQAQGRTRFTADASDITFWASSLVSPLTFAGRNIGAWAGGVEPTVREQVPNQVAILGVGCSVALNRVEGRAKSDDDDEEVVELAGAGILIADQADLTYVETAHMTHEGFLVLVERDAGTAFVRTLPRPDRNQRQPQLELGLANLCQDATFESVGAPQSPWSTREVGEVARVDGRALSTALRLSPAGAGVLAQTIRPSPIDGIESVASRTFAAGVWVRGEAGGGARLWLTSEGRDAWSNPYQLAGEWTFLATTLHTPANAEKVTFRLEFDGAPFQVSEPIVVRGAWIPPFHARPIREAGGRVFAPAALAAGDGSLALAGPVGRSSILDRRRVVDACEVVDALVTYSGGAPKQVALEIRRRAGTTLWELPLPDSPLASATFQPPAAYAIESGDELRLLAEPVASSHPQSTAMVSVLLRTRRGV